MPILPTRKKSLLAFYDAMYLRYKQAVEKDLPPGPIVELGSGKGHAQQTIPHLITSEYTQETHVNLVMDGRHLPFADESLS
ncbi:MAG: hypothetical protein OEW12_08715, partial [Deltaproteobacteria bacterium]|nr:hypothetical protein [Deltaproteobacteria bacterium]